MRIAEGAGVATVEERREANTTSESPAFDLHHPDIAIDVGVPG